MNLDHRIMHFFNVLSATSPGDWAETRPPPLPRSFSKAGETAAVLAAAGPWIAALVAGTQILGLVPDSWPFPRSGYSVLLAAAALICAFFASRMLWRGIHTGRLSVFRLLCVSAAPWALGLLLVPAAMIVMRAQFMTGSTLGFYIEILAEPRAAGNVVAWSLLGSALFGLSVAAFLWRSPGSRWKGWLLAWAALAPFTLFVLYWAGATDAAPELLRPALVGLAAIALPVYLALAGAALGKPPAEEPGANWALSVPMVAMLGFMAVASLVFDLSLLEGILTGSQVPQWEGIDQAIRTAAGSAATFGLVGLLLLTLPAVVLQARNSGIGKVVASDLRLRCRILAIGLVLVVLESLANWHQLASIRPPPSDTPTVEQEEALPDHLRPPPPPTARKKVVPMRMPGEGPFTDEIPEEGLDDLERGVHDGLEGDEFVPGRIIPGLESQMPELDRSRPAVVPFVALRALQKPELSLSEEVRFLLMQQNQTKAVITLRLLIDERGEVNEVVLQRGSGLAQLDQAAIEAGMAWRFAPLLVNGVAVPVATSWMAIYRVQ